MRAWDVTLTYSVRVTEDDIHDSIEMEQDQVATSVEAERVAIMWMAQPEDCNEAIVTKEIEVE